jgi:hypothetical protein
MTTITRSPNMTRSPIVKRFAATIKAVDGERAVVAKITTESVDRDGEVLLASGMDATDFLKSPTVFYVHQYDKPVGKCVDIRQASDHVEAKTVFATRPDKHEGEWLPDTLLHLYAEGVINGFSVGFEGVQGRRPTAKDRQRFGDTCKYVYSRWKMHEYSVAPLPANQDALRTAVAKGIVTTAGAKSIMPDINLDGVKTKQRRVIIVPVTMPSPPKIKAVKPRRKRDADKVAKMTADIVAAKLAGKIYI